MQIRLWVVSAMLLLTMVSLGGPELVHSQELNNREAIIWRDPGDVAARDLRYGPGASHLAPIEPFTFVKEDKSGVSPKFEVRDSKGVTWVVKLGEEAQSETVATRLVWSVGYFAEESYYFDRVRIGRLPKLSRGMEYVSRNEIVIGARFEPRRSNIKRGPRWDWDKNPFRGTKELSGLKILMILLNNYDTRPENNRVLYVDSGSGSGEAHYTVTDLGATLGKSGGMGGTRTKNNLEDFLSTKFVRGIEEDDGSVEFDYDTRPTKLGMLSVVYPPYYRSQVKKEKSMRGIPVAHAVWIGSLLSQLTDAQLHAAFDAAGYNRATKEGYVTALRQRISQLTQLDRRIARP